MTVVPDLRRRVLDGMNLVSQQGIDPKVLEIHAHPDTVYELVVAVMGRYNGVKIYEPLKILGLTVVPEDDFPLGRVALRFDVEC